MKLRFNIARTSSRAFTLTEAMIASTILILLIASVILCNLWGLSMSVREQIWLSSCDDAGKALGLLYSDIRSSASNSIGDFSTGSYIATANNTNQTGNALMIFPSTNTSNYVIYYYNSTSNVLVRTNYTGTTNGNYVLVSANAITNDNNLFTATDAFGNTLTNWEATPVIKIYLSFTKLQNPQVLIAPGSPVDFYQIITTIASRNRP